MMRSQNPSKISTLWGIREKRDPLVRCICILMGPPTSTKKNKRKEEKSGNQRESQHSAVETDRLVKENFSALQNGPLIFEPPWNCLQGFPESRWFMLVPQYTSKITQNEPLLRLFLFCIFWKPDFPLIYRNEPGFHRGCTRNFRFRDVQHCRSWFFLKIRKNFQRNSVRNRIWTFLNKDDSVHAYL